MLHQTIYLQLRQATEEIRRRTQLTPEIGIILGSGMGDLAERVTDTVSIPYTEIPHFKKTQVPGHKGALVFGKWKGTPVVILQGRSYYYEGYSMSEVVFPARVLCALGIHTLVLVNSAGGVNLQFHPGDLMLIEDHINLMGDNPLKGPHLAELGPRFPDLSEVYCTECVRIFQDQASAHRIALKMGVYAAMVGPTYETPAEVRMLRRLGADAVGMSIVPEALAAHHFGVRVVGLNCITNLAAGITASKLAFEDVTKTSQTAIHSIETLFDACIPQLVHRKRKASEKTNPASSIEPPTPTASI